MNAQKIKIKRKRREGNTPETQKNERDKRPTFAVAVFNRANLVGGNVGQGVLRAALHENADAGSHPDTLLVEPAGKRVGQVVYLAKRQGGSLRRERKHTHTHSSSSTSSWLLLFHD